MNFSTIAKGLRLIADGLEDQASATPAKTKTSKDTPVAEAAPAALPMYRQEPIAATNQPAPVPQVSSEIRQAFQGAHTQSKAVAREDVISAFTQLFQAKGQDIVIGILRDHGLKRISEANDAQLADLYAAAVRAANV